MNVKKVLGSNVAKYRKRKRLTQEELSEYLGISIKHLSNIETGNNFVSASLLEALSTTLGVSFNMLFYYTEKNKTSYSIKIIDSIIDEQMKVLKKKIKEEL